MVDPFVVNMKNNEEYDVRIDRKSIWGNPYTVELFGRQECIRKYKEWFVKQPNLVRQLPSLTGKRLGCHCAPESCHGEFLSELANPHENILRVMVSGSRTVTDETIIYFCMSAALKDYKKYDKVYFFHGDARGVDRVAGKIAEEKGFTVIPVPADWDGEGKKAGYLRNNIMLSLVDRCIIIWDGESKGTKHVIDSTDNYPNITDVFYNRTDVF